MKKIITIISFAILFSGCASMDIANPGNGNADLVMGPHITSNNSPYTASLMCLSGTAETSASAWIAIGQIPDLTGKFTNEDGGYRITQGAQMMASTAASKVSNIRLVERIDTSVSDFELGMAGKKVLGDGQTYTLNSREINWRPVPTGGIRGSDYTITGAITEVNYNIQSGGLEASYYNVGAKGRKYALNVAADLRLVNTRTLEVVKSVTLQKQIIGYEIGAGIFRFFGSEIINFNTGMKNNEPIQLGVRAIIEAGVTQLLGEVVGGDASGCIAGVEKAFDADASRVMQNPRDVAAEVAESLTPPAPIAAPLSTNRFIDPRNGVTTLPDRKSSSTLTLPIDGNVSTDMNKMGE